jgi:acetate kinase
VTNHVLTLNAGSSSIKFALYDGGLRSIGTGQVEGLGALPHFKVRSGDGAAIDKAFEEATGPRNHADALTVILAWIEATHPGLGFAAVGHRVVHGGVHYTAPTVIDDAVVRDLEQLIPLAPLHQPHNLAGITAARAAFPGVPQVACFDTSFHRTQPFVSDVFALPLAFYEAGIRRYGFHGLSYEYIIRHLREIAPSEAAGRVIVAHLGNGASMCAIQNGRAVGSSMAFTALDGLPMGTRCGQLDPGVLLYLMEQKGYGAAELSDLLYTKSGLKGLSNLSNDMRVLEASSETSARQAIEYFVFRAKREIGALTAALSGLDSLIFTAGIGENAATIRSAIASHMQWLGIEIDETANQKRAPIISTPASRVRVRVIATDEEAMLARHALDAIGATARAKAPANA